MTSNATTPKATKKSVLVGSHVEIDLYVPDWKWVGKGVDHLAKAQEEAAQEFMEFIRDHRHQDVTGVSVVREYQDHCSECGCEWETAGYIEGQDPPELAGRDFCVGCGAVIETD